MITRVKVCRGAWWVGLLFLFACGQTRAPQTLSNHAPAEPQTQGLDVQRGSPYWQDSCRRVGGIPSCSLYHFKGGGYLDCKCAHGRWTPLPWNGTRNRRPYSRKTDNTPESITRCNNRKLVSGWLFTFVDTWIAARYQMKTIVGWRIRKPPSASVMVYYLLATLLTTLAG